MNAAETRIHLMTNIANMGATTGQYFSKNTPACAEHTVGYKAKLS
jgi:hypothetical protein